MHWVAKDINLELQAQSDKLKKVDQNIIFTKNNVDLGNEQLTEAKQKHEKSNKCLIYLFSCVLITVLIMIASLVWKIYF